jgi:glycine/D-amino acid oxidase-like deaminating enzyme
VDVKSGYPWWPVRNGLLRDYPPLLADGECDVAVIGAGITGALIARALVETGLDTIVLDRRDVGWGSTATAQQRFRCGRLDSRRDVHVTDEG